MKLNEIFNNLLTESISQIWYHGTPDLKTIENGFSDRFISVKYIKDIDKYKDIQANLKIARESGDDKLYHQLIDTVKDCMDTFSMKKPIFLTDVFNVAKTYADPRRSVDYQNAIEGVVKVISVPGKNLIISAYGERFRMIPIKYLKQSLITNGIPEDEIDDLIFSFQWYTQGDGIKTDVIAVIAQHLGFDTVDVKGVLDSYEGGTTKSIVRMVFDARTLKINK